MIRLRRCLGNSRHAFWPTQYHYLAVGFANQDAPPRLKLARMVFELCLICGSPTEVFETERANDDVDSPDL